MESVSNSLKTSLRDEDAISSTPRKRNKTAILVFLRLIIFLTIIVSGSLVIFLVDNTSSGPHQPVLFNPAVKAFCHVAYDSESCIRALDPIIGAESAMDPNQIFTISLQTSAIQLENVISLFLSTSGSNSMFSNRNETVVAAFKNCSSSLREALSQINDTLAIMRENPFVEAQSDDKWGDMMNLINPARKNLDSCLDDLVKVESGGVPGLTEKLLQVKVLVNSGEDFLQGYGVVFDIFWSDKIAALMGRVNPGKPFSVCMCGLQLLFMFGMFWSLFRIR